MNDFLLTICSYFPIENMCYIAIQLTLNLF